MGYLFHPRRVDHGIDGHIDLVDPGTSDVLNLVAAGIGTHGGSLSDGRRARADGPAVPAARPDQYWSQLVHSFDEP